MNLIQSIHLILAAGGKCEAWHPEIGTLKIWHSMAQLQRAMADYPEGWKIYRYSFAHLCRAVEADPVDNPAVRAFGGFIKIYPDFGRVERAREITVWLNEIDNLTINRKWEIKPNGNYFNGYFSPLFSLLRDGYPPGIPAEHCIDRENLPQIPQDQKPDNNENKD